MSSTAADLCYVDYLRSFVDELFWDVRLLQTYSKSFALDLSVCGAFLYLIFRGEIHRPKASLEVGLVSR